MRIHADINLGATISPQDADRQKKTVNRLFELLEIEPGVILADEVGMGKTFVALATALTYIANTNRHKRILILTPSKELKDKWDRDIDTFRISCINDKSPLKKLAKDEGIDSIKDLLTKKDVPILTIPINRVAGLPKEDEYLCYLGAYFRRRGFSAPKRKEMLGQIDKCDLRTFNNSMVMTPERWLDEKDAFLNYDAIKDINYSSFDNTIRKRCSEKEFKDACRKIRNQIIPEFTFCIIDEAHNYKNPWVRGHKLFNDEDTPEHTLKGKFEKMLFLTATPFQLGHDELLNIFKMFKAAKTCAKDFDNRINTLKGLLSDYSKVVNRFENAWLRFSKKSRNEIPEEARFLEDCREYQDALAAKKSLEPELRKLIVRNVKLKDHRKTIYGSCMNHDKFDCGIDIPDKDKPLFFSLLRLENEIARVERTFIGITDSMATSAYSTLRESKLLGNSVKFQDNPMITKYRKMITELIHPNDETHPKINAVVNKVVERYLKGEKSLVFTFYIQTAVALKDAIKRCIDKERIARLNGITRKDDINTYIENTQKKFTSPNDPRYLIFKENLLLTHYQAIVQNSKIEPDEEDWVRITQYLGENGYQFKAKKREDYRMLLKVIEHHFFKKAVKLKKINKQDNIIKRILELENNYIKNGLYITEEEQHDQVQNNSYAKYTVNEEDIEHIKGLKAIQYILNGPNIWNYHKDILHKIDNLELRRKIQRYIIREITREDLIVEKFISAKYKDEDETWIEVINKIYAAEAIFNKTFNSETLKDRVERWLKAIVEKYEKIKDCKEEIEKFFQNINGLIEIKNDEDVREIHGNSTINRSVYFEAFNSPFRPVVLICTSIGSEGIDLQRECSGVFLYDLGWNPAALEQKIGRIDRIGSKNSREREAAQGNSQELPFIEIYRPFIKGTRDERMHRVLQNREKWFNFLLGTGERLSADENGDEANPDQTEKEEKMFLLPEDVVRLLTMNLGV
ncbi:MAG: DEAD/DEAH box helicase [Candidatus Brocadiaceae bacterium]